MAPLDYRIDQRTLDNGLRVVVNEDHSVPTVAVNLWVGVGSRHEAPGKTGFAHLFEHLMFQGSRNVASGEHFAVLMGQGGRLNATTWFDRTNYFETLPRGAYELALWMEADRHAFLLDALTQDNLDNQRDVVKEEKRQRYDNVPYGHALATLCATAFPPEHPYHHPTIGSMADLDSATLEDVHSFFRRYYRPSNTVLTLVGDVGADEGFAAAERYLGWLEDAPVPQPAPTMALGPLPSAERVESSQQVPTPRLYIGFRLPVDNTPEYLAAAAALDILGGLATSRLDKRLVRADEVAHSVSAGTMGLIDGNSLGTLVIEVVDGVELATAEEAVCAELVRFAAEGPTDVELETVLAQTERSWLSALAAMEDRADYLGHFTTLFADPTGVNDYLDRVAAVSPEDVAGATRHWLTPQARATVAYPHVPGASSPGDTDSDGGVADLGDPAQGRTR